jgi:hypothetical protein
MVDMPYFMENEEWFFFDAKKGKYFLTEKATQKAKESYLSFYKQVNEENE